MILKSSKFQLIALLAFLFTSCEQKNAYKQAEFYVRGNCGMCEERIESSLSKKEGIINSDWNVETKKLSVTYDTLKLTELAIQQSVANVGHETKNVESPKEIHDALPECCKKGNSM